MNFKIFGVRLVFKVKNKNKKVKISRFGFLTP